MKFLTNVPKKEYEKFVTSHEKSHFLQSYSWGEFAKIEKGLIPYYVGLKDKDKLVATALLLEKKLPLGFSYFYSPRGYVIDFKNKKLLTEFHNNIINFIKKQKAIFIKIDPDIIINKQNYLNEKQDINSDELKQKLDNIVSLGYRHQGFTKFFETMQPRLTFRIDMNDTLENIENKFSKTTKQRIKKAEKLGIETYLGNKDDIKTFYDLMLLTENRKDFVSHNLEYYEKLYDIYNKDNKMLLFLGKVNIDKILKILDKDKIEIEKELEQFDKKETLGKSAHNKQKELLKRLDKINLDIKNYQENKEKYGNEIILNAHVILTYKDKAWVVYAGNHNILTETYSNYLTYKHHIEYCYENGIKMYDQFGTVKDFESKRYKGLHEFKKKFGGDYIEFCGEYDYITNKPMYFVFTKLVPLYRNIIKNIAKIINRRK